MGVRLKSYLLLLGATVIWGIASAVLKFTLDGLSPFNFLSYRFLIAGIFSIIYFLRFKPKLPKNGSMLVLFIYGFIAVPLALGILFHALDRSTVLEFGLIGALGPLMVALGGAVFFREKIEKNERIGISIALIGTLITVFAPVILEGESVRLTGNILLLLFLLADSAGVLMAKKLSKENYDPMTMVNFSFLIGAFTIIPLTLFLNGTEVIHSVVNLELKYHLGVWYMALVSGTLAYLLFIKGEKHIEAGEAGLFFYLHPLFSFPLAVLWLGERITTPFIAGGLVIAIGVFIAEYRPSKKRRIQHKLH